MAKTFEEIGKEAMNANRKFPNLYPLAETVSDLAAACAQMCDELRATKAELAALKQQKP